jgi:hypothetical protein
MTGKLQSIYSAYSFHIRSSHLVISISIRVQIYVRVGFISVQNVIDEHVDGSELLGLWTLSRTAQSQC